jgi:hypothetical protein
MRPEIKTKAPPPSSFINRLLDNKSTASDEVAKVTTNPMRTVTRILHRGTQKWYDHQPPTKGRN